MNFKTVFILFAIAFNAMSAPVQLSQKATLEKFESPPSGVLNLTVKFDKDQRDCWYWIKFLDSAEKSVMDIRIDPDKLIYSYTPITGKPQSLVAKYATPLEMRKDMEIEVRVVDGQHYLVSINGERLRGVTAERGEVVSVVLAPHNCKITYDNSKWTAEPAAKPQTYLFGATGIESQAMLNIPDVDYELNFQFRAEFKGGKRTHYGFSLNSKDEAQGKAMLVFWDNGFQMIHGKNSKWLGNFNKDEFNSKWHDLKLKRTDKNFYEVFIDGKRINNFDTDIGAGGVIQFWSYGEWIFEVKNVELKIIDVGKAMAEAGTSSPIFFLTGEDTPNAVTADGVLAPVDAEGIKYVSGIRGKAIELTDANKSVLRFDNKELIGEHGTLSFWVKPYWNGSDSKNNYFLFNASNSQKKSAMRLWFWTWLRGDIPLEEKGGEVILNGKLRKMVTANDWIHVAMVWNRQNWSKIYVNGEPIDTKRFTGINMKDIKDFTIGSDLHGGNKFNGALDEIKIYKAALSDDDIRKEYRSRAIFDLMLDNTLIKAGENIELELTVAPLGTYVGNSLDKQTEPSTSGALAVKLYDKDQKCIAEKDFGMVKVERPTTFLLSVKQLPVGLYRMEVTMKDGERQNLRAFTISATDVKPENSGSGELKLGKPFFEKKFDAQQSLNGQQYQEAGPHKMDNFYCEVTIPEAYRNGEMLVIELEWPDDKPRNAAFYMYPPKGSGSMIRDRLGAGLASGNEYPVSGKMQTARYFFNAAFAQYLFEARTMSNGKPAALAALRIYPVEGNLPALKINPPKGLPGRMIGHLDEDQSFDYNLDWDNTRPKLNMHDVEAKLIRKICEYYAYTGQNYFSLPLLRYDFTSHDRSNIPGFRGVPPFVSGSIPFWMKSLRENGISFVAIVNMFCPPEFNNQFLKNDFIRENYFSRDKDGNVLRSNPYHAKVQELFEYNFEDFVRRYGKRPGLAGIDLWLQWDMIGFRELERGYDDYTVERFSKETGVKIPEFSDAKYLRRYEFLTAVPQREQWIKWRAVKTTGQIQRIRQIIDRYNPRLPLYVTVSGLPLKGSVSDASAEGVDVVKYQLEENTVDLAAINSLPNVYVTPMRNSAHQRWHEHWSNEIATTDELIYNPAISAPFRNSRGNYVNSYRTYFETFSKSPVNDRYPGHFQNVDLKPSGRYFLKELAYSLALTDAQRIAFGAQPLASLGHENEMREFTQAYRALPALPFLDIKGADDPVTARYLQTENGTYLYAVSLIHVDTQISLNVKKMRDLSSDAEIPGGNIKLKPFELRAFLIPGKFVPAWIKTTVPDEFIKASKDRLDTLEKTAEAVEMKSALERVKVCRELFEKGKYAELYRLLNSKLFRMLDFQMDAWSKGYLQTQAEMLKNSHIAVDCGSSEFFQSSGGKLFFPDRKWDETGCYGYYGKHDTVVRNTAEMPESELTPLFRTELYNFDSYRFRVKDGVYTLKAYMRIGYQPARKKGTFVLDAEINGKNIRKDMDLFELENKDGYVVLEQKGITPVGGIISLTLKKPNSPTARLLNAIEIIPEKQ